MKFYKVRLNNYNITMNINNKEMVVATLSTPLIGLDSVYINMCFPYDDCCEIKLDISNLDSKEILEIVKRTVLKKMYKTQQDILNGLQFIEFDDIKYKEKFGLSDHFSKGRVFAVKN